MGAGGVDAASPRRAAPAPATQSRAGFRDVLRLPVFAVLFGAEMQSIVGDQLARVALSVLVFDRTGSAVATAATYAATLLPAIVGGTLVSRVGDRFPRRAVMIAVDGARAGCFAAMALPGTPLGLIVALVIVAVALGPVFSAAQVSYLATELDPEQFRTATAARMTASQSAQVVGFVLGGAAVATIGARGALGIDAATFAASVIAVGALVARRPERTADSAGTVAGKDDAATVLAPGAGGFQGLWRTRRVRRLLALCCLVGFFVVPEGLAAPFARSAGASSWAVGVLLGAAALGAAVGAVLVGSVVPPAARSSVSDAMAVSAGLPLLLTAIVPDWPVAAAAWCVSGLLTSYMVETTAAFVQAVPANRRAHYLGVAGALLLSAQGVGLLAFGAVATVLAPATAIALAGVVGSALAAAVVIGWRDRRAPRHARDAGQDRRQDATGHHDRFNGMPAIAREIAEQQ